MTVELSDNAMMVLERRYLARDAEGRLVEKADEMFERVAATVMQTLAPLLKGQ